MDSTTTSTMTMSDRLEAWLFDYRDLGDTFSAVEAADDLGISSYEVTRLIQAYLRAQRAANSSRLYVLHRQPGTRGRMARWIVGTKEHGSKDAAQIGEGFHDDVVATVKRAFGPDLRRIGQISPRARRKTERQIEGVVEGAMQMLKLAVTGMTIEADEDAIR